MYDLNLMPIRTDKGQPLQETTGFSAVSPSRRAVRSRSEDLLILSLTLHGSKSNAFEFQQEWLNHLSQVFFKTSGSVTSALRSLIETLNLTMMELNLKQAQEGGPITGAINLAGVHRHSLYIAQCGLTHAFTLTHEGLQHFSDTGQLDRGLGLSRTPSIRYYQADLGTGGYLFMAESPPSSWTEDFLLSDGFPSVEHLRRRLLHQASPTFRLDLVQIVPGEGQVKTIQPMRRPEKTSTPTTPEEQPEIPVIEPVRPSDSVEEIPKTELSETQEISRPSEPVEISNAAPKVSDQEMFATADTAPETEPGVEDAMSEQESVWRSPLPTSERLTTPDGGVDSQSTPFGGQLEPKPARDTVQAAKEKLIRQREKIRRESLKGMAAFFDWWGQVREKTSTFFKDLLARISPAEQSDAPKLSQSTLLLIAVGVPLVIVAIAVTVYLARGRTLQYQFYFDQAQAASQSALAAEDPNAARSQWVQSLTYLEQAEEFRSTNEAATLREEAQAAMDILDGAVRLVYQPAIAGELYSEINITRIISYGLDLYMLDAAGGRVIHATGRGQGYEIDPDFLCSAGNYSGGGVDALVDMVALPINNPYQAHILAADAVGNVIYCSPGQDPVAQSLPASNAGEGEILKVAYGNNSLFVLDGSSRTIQVYIATNGQFLEPPVNFFTDAQSGEIPDLSNVVDLAVNGPELYLLNNTGSLIDCVYTGLPGNPVNCESPVTYVDGRAGQAEQPVVMPDGEFISVLYTTPPDPSISILDAVNADIYRFSLRFRLHQRFRPDLGDHEVDSPSATAFTIGIDQVAFIAFGNQVFYAYVE